MVNVLRWLLEPRPDDRPSAKQLLEHHPIIKNIYERRMREQDLPEEQRTVQMPKPPETEPLLPTTSPDPIRPQSAPVPLTLSGTSIASPDLPPAPNQEVASPEAEAIAPEAGMKTPTRTSASRVAVDESAVENISPVQKFINLLAQG